VESTCKVSVVPKALWSSFEGRVEAPRDFGVERRPARRRSEGW
jgi:hypothetical protein